jgi:hypothetical protein
MLFSLVIFDFRCYGLLWYRSFDSEVAVFLALDIHDLPRHHLPGFGIYQNKAKIYSLTLEVAWGCQQIRSPK